MIVLRHDKGTKILAGLLVPYAAVGILQAEHPIKIPADLGEKVGKLSTGFWNLEIQLAHCPVEHFPRP